MVPDHQPLTAQSPQRRRGTGGRPARAEIEGRNARILQVATDLFLARGYAATTIGDIATTAGVAKKTIYSWYGDKSAIFAAIIRAEAERIDSSLLGQGADGVSAEAALFRLARRIREVTLDPHTSAITRLMAGEATAFPEMIARISADGVARMYRSSALTLAALRERGQLAFAEADLQRLAERFFDAVIGLSSLRHMLEADHAGPDDEELRARVAMFLHHLSAR